MAKVLLVDDAAFMRMRCARLLQENGHEVIEASTGARRSRSIRATAPTRC